jgi:anti-anti-sigma factor
MAITTTAPDGTATVAVLGDVDMATADQFRAAVAAAVAAHGRVCVDLTAPRFFDSSGIRILLEFADHVTEVIVPREEVVARVLHIAAIDQVVSVRTV